MPTNVEQFVRELERELDQVLTVDVPRAVIDMALEMRQDAEDATPLGTETRRVGWKGQILLHLRDCWHADQTFAHRYGERGGADLAESELGRYNPDASIFVYNSDFRAWFHEWGTVKMSATPMLRPAGQRQAHREIVL